MNKIFLSLNNYSGANIWGARFIKNSSFEFKIAAYYKNHKYLDIINYLWDAVERKNVRKKELFQIFGQEVSINASVRMIKWIFDDLIDWEPDLIISDCEPISAHLALALGIDLWYASPLLLGPGIVWPEIPICQYKLNLPKANRYLIYSPIGDVAGAPELKENFEYIKPYHEEVTLQNINICKQFKNLSKFVPKEYIVTTGETSFLADAIYSERPVVLGTDPSDIEQVFNGTLVESYQLGINAIGVCKSKKIWTKYAENFQHEPIILENTSKELHEIIRES